MPTATTSNSAQGWAPDVQAFLPEDALPGALILSTATVAGTIEGDNPALRVPYVDDADAGVVDEGATILEADPTRGETVVHTDKVAQLVRLSRELAHQTNASQLITSSIARAMVTAADRLYLAAEGNLNGSTGLLNTAGIIDGGTIGSNLDELIDAVATIEANKGTASNIIAAPNTWAELQKLKTQSGSNEALLGAGTAAGERSVLGLPVSVSVNAPAGSLLVIDKAAVVAAVGEVQLTTSSDAYFASDSIGVRCTWRIGWQVMRPNRIARLQLAAA